MDKNVIWNEEGLNIFRKSSSVSSSLLLFQVGKDMFFGANVTFSAKLLSKRKDKAATNLV